MSENKDKPKKLMEPFLRKMAIRDEAIIESKKGIKSKRGKNIASKSRQTSEQHVKRKSDILDDRNNSNQLSVAKTSFPNIANHLKIELQTTVARDLKKPEEPKVGPSPTVTSVVSETSIKSSVSSISVKSTFISTHKMEDSPSYYQRLVIPFSGFTEEDVKEIRGGREPKVKRSTQTYHSSMSTNAKETRPVLKKYQSEKRKSSYDRYVQESLENYIPTRNNTEDSSYNTVIAVKMMVEDNTRLGEIISNVITDEHDGNNSKDTIFLPNSELFSAHTDQQMNPASSDNSFIQHTDISSMPTHKPDSSYQKMGLKLMNLRGELQQFDTEYEKMQEEYDEAEKAYFTAKLNLHRMKMRRERLISQLVHIEKDLSRKQ